jgi:hypothetical protein
MRVYFFEEKRLKPLLLIPPEDKLVTTESVLQANLLREVRNV